jgi:hypothetical protein
VRLLVVAHLDALPEALAFLPFIVIIVAATIVVVPVLLLVPVLLVASIVLSCEKLVSALGVWVQLMKDSPSWARARASRPRHTKAKRITLSFMLLVVISWS